MIMMDMLDGDPAPKRGDIVQTNVGDRRERTWLVLGARKVKRKAGLVPRYQVHMARWWELEPEIRVLLYRSAERNGGQRVIYFKRYSPQWKKRKTFEQYMGGW